MSQQGGAASLSFTSQHGPVRLDALRVIEDGADGGEAKSAHAHQAHSHPHAGREPVRGQAQVEPERHRPSRHEAHEHPGEDAAPPARADDGERVVFSEEGGATRAIRLLVRGEMDIDLIEALEDFLRRQKRRLTRG